MSTIGDSACGSGGRACTDCSATGLICYLNNGTCTGAPTCGSSTCGSGCCQSGTCMSGTADTACGKNGLACTDCTLWGTTCDASSKSCKSTSTCGPSNCPLGCCSGGVCLPGTSTSQCGSSGAPCAACQVYDICTGGACTVDPTSNWTVKAVSATISQAKLWDGSGDLPDPYFGIDWGGCASWNLDKCGAWQKDTYTPVWNADMATVKASTLKAAWCAFVIDGDSLVACMVPFQTMAQCSVVVTDAVLNQGSMTINYCPCPDDNINYVTNLKLEFRYVP